MEALRPGLELFFPKSCYDKVFVEQDFFNGPCLAAAASKAVGYSIILGSILVKVPQILKIFSAKSGQGLSVVSLLLELVSFTASAAYGFRNQFPFSSYGENGFLMVQTFTIVMLVLLYSKKSLAAGLFPVMYGIACFLLFSAVLPDRALYALQTANLPIMVVSKLIQIATNMMNGSTGQLSMITVSLTFGGSIARILTSLQETGDMLMVTTFIVASSLNGLLFTQILFYWNSGAQPTGSSQGGVRAKRNRKGRKDD